MLGKKLKIEPKFQIGDTVQHLYNSNNDNTSVIYRILEIKCFTCYAGTQIIYVMRPLVKSKPLGDLFKEAKTRAKEGHAEVTEPELELYKEKA